jgi:SNF2-related domain
VRIFGLRPVLNDLCSGAIASSPSTLALWAPQDHVDRATASVPFFHSYLAKAHALLGKYDESQHHNRPISDGLSFAEAMRMLAGAGIADGGAAGQADAAWSETVAGPWLAETLRGLRHSGGLAHVDPGRSFQGTLRPYQLAGVQWLYLLARLRLGGCLAGDMGLGKTIQVLSLVLVLRKGAEEKRKPSLLPMRLPDLRRAST